MKPVENIMQIVNSSSRKCRNEEMTPLGATIGQKFDKTEFEEKLNDENHSLIISRLVFKNTIVDTLRKFKKRIDRFLCIYGIDTIYHRKSRMYCSFEFRWTV